MRCDGLGTDAVGEALQHLASQFSMTRDEWRRHYRGGDQLLDGLVSRGFVNVSGDRYAISPAGRRRAEA